MSLPPDSLASPKAASPAPLEVITPKHVQQHRALGVMALLALGFLIRLAMPVGIGLFLGALLGFTLEPVYARLRARKVRPAPAGLICALGATLLIATTATGLGILLVRSGAYLFGSVREKIGTGGSFRASLDAISGKLAVFHINVGELSAKLENEVLSLGSRAAGFAADLAGATFAMMLALLFVTMTAYFVLRHWSKVVVKLEQMLPIDPQHTHVLLGQFRTVGRQVLLGTVVTGLFQGLMAGIGYWIFGVQAPAFFGAVTGLASLIPGVGTALVWGSVGAGLVLFGHVGAGIGEMAYGFVVVAIVADYVVRPQLVGSEKGVPALLTFVALFGGVEAFGIIGLILGPILATLSLAVLKTYALDVADKPVRTDDAKLDSAVT